MFVAKELKKIGVESHFLSFSPHFSKKYLQEIEESWSHYPKDIFARKKGIISTANSHSSEVELSKYVLAMIKTDRVLKNWNIDSSISSLKRFSQWIDQLFTNQKFDLVICESTWTVERLIFERAVANEVVYVTPTSTRYPPGCWFFSQDFDSREVSSTSPIVNLIDFHGSHLFGSGNYQLDTHPTKLKKKSSKHLLPIIVEKLLVFGESKNNPTQRSFWDYLRFDSTLRILLRRPIIKFLNFLLPKEFSGKEDFVFATFHVQPESSIDAMAPHVADQIDTFIRIANSLPSDWLLLIKDHPHGLGNRKLLDYAKLNKQHKIRLISSAANTSNFLARAKFTYTATGTVAIEASVAGGSVLLATDTFFASLPGVFVHKEPWLFDWEGHASLEPLDLAARRRQCDTFFANLLSKCYKGVWASRRHSDFSVAEDNIRQIVDGIRNYLTQTNSKLSRVVEVNEKNELT